MTDHRHQQHVARDAWGGPGTVVIGPRSTDAVGAALVSVFATRPALPSDMAAILTKLDAVQ